MSEAPPHNQPGLGQQADSEAVSRREMERLLSSDGESQAPGLVMVPRATSNQGLARATQVESVELELEH